VGFQEWTVQQQWVLEGETFCTQATTMCLVLLIVLEALVKILDRVHLAAREAVLEIMLEVLELTVIAELRFMLNETLGCY
jgi:hypothetical protein